MNHLAGDDMHKPEDWTQLSDDQLVTVIDDPHNDQDKKTTKTAREWAAEHKKPEYVSTTYW